MHRHTSTHTSAAAGARGHRHAPLTLRVRSSRLEDPIMTKINDVFAKLHAKRCPVEQARGKRVEEITSLLRKVAAEEMGWLQELDCSESKKDTVATVAQTLLTTPTSPPPDVRPPPGAA